MKLGEHEIMKLPHDFIGWLILDFSILAVILITAIAYMVITWWAKVKGQAYGFVKSPVVSDSIPYKFQIESIETRH